MDENDDLMLNLTTGGSSHEDKKKVKLKPKERMKRIRDEKRLEDKAAKNDELDEKRQPQKQENQQNTDKPKEKKTKPNDASMTSGGQTKFSSLFRNNPEIPKLENTSADQVVEKVFSNQSFAALNLHPHMVANLEANGFKEATSVQMKAIPHILSCKDVLIKSQTGSGKTLAYGIPVIQHLQEIRPKIERCHGPYAVVICPTRELALQTYETFLKLIKPFTWVVPGCFMGGEQKNKEKSRLRKGINVLIATPGRLLDHLENTQSLQLCRLKWIIIDEADRMTDLGFEETITKILQRTREKGPDNQLAVLLSATLSPGVERLAGISLKDPVTVDMSQDSTTTTFNSMVASATSNKMVATPTLIFKKAGGEEPQAMTTPSGLRHHFIMVPSKLRLVTLVAFVLWKCRYSNKKSKMLVFMSTQDMVDFHYLLLNAILNRDLTEDDENRLLFFKLHGEMAQKDRTRVFKEFSETMFGILLCTDVAARGLDLPAVRWIIQYTAPTSAEDYVHRAGRTARVGSQGRALLVLSPSEQEYIKLLNDSKISLSEVKLDDVLPSLLLEDELVPGQAERSHTAHERATALQRHIEELKDKDLKASARKAYQSYIRAYSSYPSSMKHIFHIKTLHLGHVAKSFGLQDAPTHIGGIVGKFAKMDKGKKKRKDRAPPKKRIQNHLNVKAMALSEFSAGAADKSHGPVTQKMGKSLKSAKNKFSKGKVKRLKR